MSSYPIPNVIAQHSRGERQQLRREQRSVVVVEHPVEYEYPLEQ